MTLDYFSVTSEISLCLGSIVGALLIILGCPYFLSLHDFL
jgi:hypothetical protein